MSLKDGQFRKDLSIDNDYHVERAEGTNYVTVGFSLKNLEKEKCFMEERLKEGGIKRFEERIKAL